MRPNAPLRLLADIEPAAAESAEPEDLVEPEAIVETDQMGRKVLVSGDCYRGLGRRYSRALRLPSGIVV